MQLFLSNIPWMLFNVLLAVIGMTLGLVALKITRLSLQLVVLFCWLLFIPNTIYLVTDLTHLSWQLSQVSLAMQVLITAQFFLLAGIGVVTFVVGFYPFEKVLHSFKNNLPASRHGFHYDFTVEIILGMNLLIGFGLILGRVYRIHSWYVFTQTRRVIDAVVNFSKSPGLLVISILIGCVIFVSYYLLRDTIQLYLKKMKLI
jgi:uncharacterized membrane protein